MKGALYTRSGSCPVCGVDCQRTHAFNGARIREAYACSACGPTEYMVSA